MADKVRSTPVTFRQIPTNSRRIRGTFGGLLFIPFWATKGTKNFSAIMHPIPAKLRQLLQNCLRAFSHDDFLNLFRNQLLELIEKLIQIDQKGFEKYEP